MLLPLNQSLVSDQDEKVRSLSRDRTRVVVELLEGVLHRGVHQHDLRDVQVGAEQYRVLFAEGLAMNWDREALVATTERERTSGDEEQPKDDEDRLHGGLIRRRGAR